MLLSKRTLLRLAVVMSACVSFFAVSQETQHTRFFYSDNDYYSFKDDINDDGVLDLFLQPLAADSQIVVVLGDESLNYTHSNSNAYTIPAVTHQGRVDWSLQHMKLVFGDFNGDGDIDILGFKIDSGEVYFVPSFKGVFDFNAASVQIEPLTSQFSHNVEYYSLFAGDVNGDTIDDILAFANVKKNEDGEKIHHFIVYSDGSEVEQLLADNEARVIRTPLPVALSYFDEILNKDEFKAKRMGRTVVHDFSGDGLVDIFIQGYRRAHPHLYFESTGAGFDFNNPLEYQNNIDGENWAQQKAFLTVADINGDGIADLSRFPKDEADETTEIPYLTPSTGQTGTYSLSTEQSSMTVQSAQVAAQSEDKPKKVKKVKRLRLSLTEGASGVNIDWQDADNDFFIVERLVGDEWVELYNGTRSFFFESDLPASEVTYRVAACDVLPNRSRHCSAYKTRNITVEPYSQATESLRLFSDVQSELARSLSLDNTTTTVDFVDVPDVPVVWNSVAGQVGNQDYSVTFDTVDNAGYYYVYGEGLGQIANVAPFGSPANYSIVRNNPPGNYSYQVKACNRFGCSALSKPGYYTVEGAPQRPGFTYAPFGAAQGVSYRVHWDASNSNMSGLTYEMHGEMSGQLYSGGDLETQRTQVVGTYFYKTRACNSYDCSTFSSNSMGTDVLASPTLPTIIDDSISLTEDTVGYVYPLDNDTDSLGGNLLRINSFSQPQHGHVALGWHQGKRRFVYTPNDNHCATSGFADSFVYYAEDATNASQVSSAQVRINISCQNDTPVIEGLTSPVEVLENQVKTVTFFVNDAETTSQDLSISATSSNTTLLPVHRISFGTDPQNSAKRFMYLAPQDYKFGTSVVTVSVSDGNLSSSRQVALEVIEVADPPVLNLGDDLLVPEWYAVELNATAQDQTGIASTKWEYVSGPVPWRAHKDSTNWYSSNGTTTSFFLNRVERDMQLVLKFSATANDGEITSEEVVLTVYDRPDGDVVVPVNNSRLATNAPLLVRFANLRDSSDQVIRAQSRLRKRDLNGVWSWLNDYEEMNIDIPNKFATKDYGSVSSLGLMPNTLYRAYARALDDGPPGTRVGNGWQRASNFYVNDKPVINGSSSISGVVGSPIPIETSALDIVDSDDSNHTVEIQNGSNYSINSSSITFSAGTLAGSYPVDIKVNDGIELSEVYQVSIEVTEDNVDRKVTFIHTDLLGSPAAETDENGNIL